MSRIDGYVNFMAGSRLFLSRLKIVKKEIMTKQTYGNLAVGHVRRHNLGHRLRKRLLIM